MNKKKVAKELLKLAKDMVAGVGVYVSGYENKTILRLTTDIQLLLPTDVARNVDVDIDGNTNYNGHTGLINVYPIDGSKDVKGLKKDVDKVLRELKKKGFKGKTFIDESKMRGGDIVRIDITASPYEGMEELYTHFTYTSIGNLMSAVGFIEEEEIPKHYGGTFKIDDYLKAVKKSEVKKKIKEKNVEGHADALTSICKKAKELGHSEIYYS